jgi:hypothetical protein
VGTVALDAQRSATLGSCLSAGSGLAGCFEQVADDMRALLRLASGRSSEPSAAILDSRTLRSTPESSERAGYDGAKRESGSKVHWPSISWAIS